MNVIWITSDTYRQDHMGAYGHPFIRTPSLDALAARSTRFDRCYIAAFPTMPTRADHLTGRFTMTFMGWEPLGRELRTLPQLLSRSGITTAAVVDTPFYQRNGMNYDRGFRHFHFVPGQMYGGEGLDIKRWWRKESDRHVAKTMTLAGDWLEQHYKESFFLYVDTWDPHEPWDAPDYYTELYMPDYDGEIVHPVYARWQDVPGFSKEKVDKAHAQFCGETTLVDTWVGQLLRKVENLGIADETAILFTSDHGFYFGEHDGLFGKLVVGKRPDGLPFVTGPNFAAMSRLGRRPDRDASWDHSPLYEEVASIPLLIHVPGVDPGVSSSLVSAVDLMPTTLDLFGQPVPDWVDGRSLLAAVREPSTPVRELVVSSHPFVNRGMLTRAVDDVERGVGAEQVTTITSEEWSFLYSAAVGKSELFHLASDPKQEKDVIGAHKDVAREMHQHLLRFMREAGTSPELIKPREELRL